LPQIAPDVVPLAQSLGQLPQSSFGSQAPSKSQLQTQLL
jgi:hypothetical protein